MCWKRYAGPAGPVDSRLMKAPTCGAHLLLAMKPCAASRMGSSPPLKRNTRGAASWLVGSATSARAVSSMTPTQDAQSEAPVN